MFSFEDIFRMTQRKRLGHLPSLDQCRFGIFSIRRTPKGDLIVHLMKGYEPEDAILFKVEPPLVGKYDCGSLIHTLTEWLRAKPNGFEITVQNATTFVVYPNGTDSDVVPWVGEFEIPGIKKK